MNNSFGNIFRLTTFGESHGKAIGGIIDGWDYSNLRFMERDCKLRSNLAIF